MVKCGGRAYRRKVILNMGDYKEIAELSQIVEEADIVVKNVYLDEFMKFVDNQIRESFKEYGVEW